MEHVELILSGFGIVMSVLAMLWGVTTAVAVGARGPAKPKDKGPAKPAIATPVQAEAQTSAGVPVNHLAVIAAAVAASFDAPHKIVSVHGPRAHVSAWTQQGLFEHFASHRMPWHNAVPHGRHTKS